MEDEKKDFFKELSSNKKALTFIILIGIAGILMLGFSEIFSGKSKKQKTTESVIDESIAFSGQGYTDALEDKVMELIGSIDGVGKANVMITLDSAFEYRYAVTKDTTTDISDPSSERDGGSRSQSQKEEYVYIEDENGRKQALLISQVLPKIKGVVVVCEGGDTLAVRNNVINAVTTALGIYSNNVYVTKMSSK